MKINFDLDGVLRSLHEYAEEKFGMSITEWNSENGNKMMACINENPPVLEEVGATEYYGVIAEHFSRNDSEIWTCQPDAWILPTARWIRRYLPRVPVRIFQNPPEKFRELLINKSVVLVEDYPLFSDYSRILLIDRKYNRRVKTDKRIFSPEQLRGYLEALK